MKKLLLLLVLVGGCHQDNVLEGRWRQSIDELGCPRLLTYAVTKGQLVPYNFDKDCPAVLWLQIEECTSLKPLTPEGIRCMNEHIDGDKAMTEIYQRGVRDSL